MALQKCYISHLLVKNRPMYTHKYIFMMKKTFLKIYFFVCVLAACMFVYHMCVWYLQKTDEDIRSSETGVTDYCELLNGCWESQ